MDHLHLRLDNVHCEDCGEKFYPTFNNCKIRTSEEVDIPLNNDSASYVHIVGGDVYLYRKPTIDSIELLLQDSIRRITKHISRTDLMFYLGNLISKKNEN
jgi:NAD-dependent SIR2 family protein deacetylase